MYREFKDVVFEGVAFHNNSFVKRHILELPNIYIYIYVYILQRTERQREYADAAGNVLAKGKAETLVIVTYK